jgi:hypothetical protein
VINIFNTVHTDISIKYYDRMMKTTVLNQITAQYIVLHEMKSVTFGVVIVGFVRSDLENITLDNIFQ